MLFPFKSLLRQPIDYESVGVRRTVNQPNNKEYQAWIWTKKPATISLAEIIRFRCEVLGLFRKKNSYHSLLLKEESRIFRVERRLRILVWLLRMFLIYHLLYFSSNGCQKL